jgi:hypothetical protein
MIDRVFFDSHVCISHDGVVAFVRNMRIQGLILFFDIDGFPLKGSGRAFL